MTEVKYLLLGLITLYSQETYVANKDRTHRFRAEEKFVTMFLWNLCLKMNWKIIIRHQNQW